MLVKSSCYVFLYVFWKCGGCVVVAKNWGWRSDPRTEDAEEASRDEPRSSSRKKEKESEKKRKESKKKRKENIMI